MKSLFVSFLLLSSLVLASKASAQRVDVSFGLAIGLNDIPAGATGLQRLRYADDDAVRFFELFSRVTDVAMLLTKLDATTERKMNARPTFREAPSRHAVQEAFARIAQGVHAAAAAHKNPVVYVAYSGHGTLEGADEPGLTLTDGVLTRTELQDALESLRPARVHLIVDACHAGAIVGARGAFDSELEAEQVALDNQTTSTLWLSHSIERLDHVGVVLATAGANQTHEWSAIEGGLFSHEVLSGLMGGADVNGDEQIQYSELWAFVSAANHGMRSPQTRPEVVVRPPEGNFQTPLLTLHGDAKTRLLQGDLSKLGHFFIELEGGQRLLDAHFAPGQEQTLALPRYIDAYVVTRDREARVAPEVGARVDASTLSFSRRDFTARGALARALNEGFFRKPFGRSYYEGFVDSQGIVPVPFPAHQEAAFRQGAEGAAERPSTFLRNSLLAATGIAAVASASAFAIAWVAKHDYEQSQLEQPPADLDRRYRRANTAALTAGGAALTFGAAAVVVEARLRRRLSVAFGADQVLLRRAF